MFEKDVWVYLISKSSDGYYQVICLMSFYLRQKIACLSLITARWTCSSLYNVQKRCSSSFNEMMFYPFLEKHRSMRHSECKHNCFKSIQRQLENQSFFSRSIITFELKFRGSDVVGLNDKSSKYCIASQVKGPSKKPKGFSTFNSNNT